MFKMFRRKKQTPPEVVPVVKYKAQLSIELRGGRTLSLRTTEASDPPPSVIEAYKGIYLWFS